MKKLKKFFKLFVGRFLWFILIIALELIVIILGFLYIDLVILEKYFDAYVVVRVLLELIFMFYIANSRAGSAYKLSWMLFVGIIPEVGIPCYAMFANKTYTKRTKKKIKPMQDAVASVEKLGDDITPLIEKQEGGDLAVSVTKYLDRVTVPSIADHSEIKYYPLGDDIYPVILEELKKAEKYIFIEFFIINKGKMWDSILEILKEKVAQGVDVRVMYDDFGSLSYLPMDYPKKIQALGIKCIAFNKVRPLVDLRLNYRDHRKIMVIDGQVGFTGGFNLADEYINEVVRFGHWKDNGIMIKGKGVYNLTMLFLSLWLSVTKGDYLEMKDEKYLPVNYDSIETDGYIYSYEDIPYDEEQVSETIYLKLISGARKYLYITTPYLIIDEELKNALCTAAKSGVDVRIITPRIPDKKIVFSITRSYYGGLLEAGVKIYEYVPGFIHEKTFIVDDTYGTVGTANLDYRSLNLHIENVSFMYKCSCIADMKKDFDETIEKSEEITIEKYKKVSRFKKIWWRFCRIFAPLL